MTDASLAKEEGVWVSSVLLPTMRDDIEAPWSDDLPAELDAREEARSLADTRHVLVQSRDDRRSRSNSGNENVILPVGAGRWEASRRPGLLCS